MNYKDKYNEWVRRLKNDLNKRGNGVDYIIPDYEYMVSAGWGHNPTYVKVRYLVPGAGGTLDINVDMFEREDWLNILQHVETGVMASLRILLKREGGSKEERGAVRKILEGLEDA